MSRIALATSRAHAELTPEDRLLRAQLASRGSEARAAIWDDPAEDWAAYDLVVIRSCWDYHLRPDDFRAWLTTQEAADTLVWNPPPLVRWNMDKGYLRELAAHGVPTIPTVWIDQGDAVTLADVLADQGWEAAVVKPRISATAHGTWRVSRAEAVERQGEFHAQAQMGGLLVQPFLPEIASAGEWSLVFFAGAFSHALLKLPRAGDFRVQEEHGGHATPTPPDDMLIAQARDILAASPQMPLYARVDGIILNGQLRLMELELIEPALYMEHLPDAVARFATAIVDAL